MGQASQRHHAPTVSFPHGVILGPIVQRVNTIVIYYNKDGENGVIEVPLLSTKSIVATSNDQFRLCHLS